MTGAERQRRYRDKQRGGPPREVELKPCGTYAAWKRHKRRGENPCNECQEAFRDYHRKRRIEGAPAEVQQPG